MFPLTDFNSFSSTLITWMICQLSGDGTVWTLELRKEIFCSFKKSNLPRCILPSVWADTFVQLTTSTSTLFNIPKSHSLQCFGNHANTCRQCLSSVTMGRRFKYDTVHISLKLLTGISWQLTSFILLMTPNPGIGFIRSIRCYDCCPVLTHFYII